MTSVAVIVPAAGCACSQLDAVIPQLADGDRVILVVNGTPAHDCGAGRASTDGRALATIVIGAEPVGAAAARNAGAALGVADHEVLAFLDADDAADPAWRTELEAAFGDPGVDVVGGAIRFRAGAGPAHLVVPAIEYWLRPGVFGGNVAFRASAWGRVNGFDPRLTACEDTDIAWRVGELGMRIAVSESMLVDVLSRSVGAEMRQRFGWGWWAAALIRKHGVCDGHLPSLGELIRHKRHDGFTASWLSAALAQWAGQMARQVGLGGQDEACRCPIEECARCRAHRGPKRSR